MIRLWRRNPPPIVLTLTADTSGFDEAMRGLRRSIEEMAATIGKRLAEAMRPFVDALNFGAWLLRSGQRVCGADHEHLTGRCPTCKAST